MRKCWRAIKAALLQVHSVAGLVLALLLALIALTGATMSFEDEIVDQLNAGIMRVAPRQAPALMPDELIARLKAAQDVGKVSAVTLASDPSAAVHVRFARDEQGARPSSLYVDPYDARVLGTPRGEEFFATVRKLHRWLLIPGDAKGWGRQITGVAALGLIVMLISGLVLRWPRRAGSVKMWLKPNLGLSGRGLHRSLHAVIGTWVLPVYLVMTLPGCGIRSTGTRTASSGCCRVRKSPPRRCSPKCPQRRRVPPASARRHSRSALIARGPPSCTKRAAASPRLC